MLHSVSVGSQGEQGEGTALCSKAYMRRDRRSEWGIISSLRESVPAGLLYRCTVNPSLGYIGQAHAATSEAVAAATQAQKAGAGKILLVLPLPTAPPLLSSS